MTYARDSIYEREAVADERLIMRDALRRGMGETTYAQVRAEFDARQKQGDFVIREGQKHDSGRSFTTPETIAQERANVRQVVDGRNSVTPMMNAKDAHAQAKTQDFLNLKQRAVIEEVLTSLDRVHGLQGLAGTGKTTALEAIRKGAEKNGYTVRGFAPSSKAAGALRDAGVEAKTLQSFLASKQPDPKIRHLYMLDESSLASSRQMRGFLQKIGPNDRVLVIGDTRQHQAVDAGRPFQQMQDAGMRTAQLDQIMRQRSNPELLAVVQQLATGKIETGIKMLADQGRVTEIPNPKDRIAAIARDYAADPEKTIVVSPDNESRQQINEAVRTELLIKGVLSKDGQQFRTLSHRNDMTGADRTWAARYDVGDVLQYTRGSKEHGLKQDSFATVRAVDARANTLTVERAEGQRVTYDPRRLKGVNAYKENEREFATGDRIQFTGQEKELKVANRDLGTITSIEPGRMTVRLAGKAGRSITFDPDKVRSLDHGYAVTSHSSQGLTERRVIVNVDTDASRNLVNSRLAYVAISRAQTDARIYTNDAANLGRKLAGDIDKTSAVNFQQKRIEESSPPQAPERCSHKFADPNSRLAAVALDYASRPEKTIVIAPDRAERHELTQLIRADLYATGRLGAVAREVPVLVQKNQVNPKLAASYTPGDKIQFQIGSPGLNAIPHNSEATVVSTDSKRNLLTIRTDTERQEVTYDPIHLKRQTKESTVYRQETREVAEGERIRFTAADKSQGIRKGDLATVIRIDDRHAMTLLMDNGKKVSLNPDRARHIDYGYAVDGSDRVSADRVIVTGETLDPRILKALPLKHRDLATYTSSDSILQHEEIRDTFKAAQTPQIQPQQSRRQQQDFGLGF